jgi:uncharacterized protein with GYD domain
MAKYLFIANLKADGVKGVLAQGGTARAEAVSKATKSVGGQLETFYFAFGSDDVYAIVDVPDNVSAAAMAMSVAATGIVGVRTVVLLTPAEIDQAAKRPVEYAPPGR